MAEQKQGRPARTYIQQLCDDTGCSPEDLPEVMNDREKWRERGISVLAVRHDDDDDDDGTASLVNMFICYFLEHTKDFHYYWLGGSCKV